MPKMTKNPVTMQEYDAKSKQKRNKVGKSLLNKSKLTKPEKELLAKGEVNK